MTKHHKNRLLLDFLFIFVIILLLFVAAAKVLTAGRTAVLNSERESELLILESALENYYQDHRNFPRANLPPIDLSGKIIAEFRDSKNVIETLVQGGYLTSVPRDPDPAYKYVYIVASDDNFTGGEKLQRYALYAVKENITPNFATTLTEVTTDVTFIAVGNATEQFAISTTEYNELMLGDTNIPRAEGKTIVEPKGGTAFAF